jgi:hypothetical protein
MKIQKAAAVLESGIPLESQLERINQQSKSPLTAEQVYVFSVRLCDDQPDRDLERFDTAALPELAAMFVGKTGICDHEWSARQQVARVFDTEVVREDGVSWIRAWAYMLRLPQNEAVIADIEGGIRKEVSIGCAMGQRVCSVCGSPYGTCSHQKGEVYDGQVCVAVLRDPKDAYEFSFVAVPAQKAAAVTKQYRQAVGMNLLELVEKHGSVHHREALKQLQEDAELGRVYVNNLRHEVVRLGLAADLGLDQGTLESICKRMDHRELENLRLSLEKRAAALYPATPQLGGTKQEPFQESAFLI